MLRYVRVVLVLAVCALVVGCATRDGRRTGSGDAGGDGAMPSDGSLPGEDGSPGGDAGPGVDGGPGTDSGIPPETCNLDIKLLGLPTDPACEDTWTEAGATLAFVNTTADDCSPDRCSYMTEPGTNQVWLYPGRLEVRLQSAGCAGGRIEVDIHDYCGAGCTKAFAYSDGVEVASAENTASGAETLVLVATDPIDTNAVSSCEGLVYEIRVR